MLKTLLLFFYTDHISLRPRSVQVQRGGVPKTARFYSHLQMSQMLHTHNPGFKVQILPFFLSWTAGLHTLLSVLPGQRQQEVTPAKFLLNFSPLQEADEHRFHGHEPLPHATDPEPAILPPGESAAGANGAGGHQADLPAGERDEPGWTQLRQRRRGGQLSGVAPVVCCKGRFFWFCLFHFFLKEGVRVGLLSRAGTIDSELFLTEMSSSIQHKPARLLISIPATLCLNVLNGLSVVSFCVGQSTLFTARSNPWCQFPPLPFYHHM